MDNEMPLATAGERSIGGRLTYGLEIAACDLGIIARFRAFDYDGRPCGAQQIVPWETINALRANPPEPKQ